MLVDVRSGTVCSSTVVAMHRIMAVLLVMISSMDVRTSEKAKRKQVALVDLAACTLDLGKIQEDLLDEGIEEVC